MNTNTRYKTSPLLSQLEDDMTAALREAVAEKAAIRQKSDAQLADDLSRAETILMVETFGNDHEARQRIESEKWSCYNELQRRGALHSQKQAAKAKSPLAPYIGMSQEEMDEYDGKPKVERPMCQHPGCINRATVIVGWVQNSYFKVFCDAHAGRKPKGYYVGRLVGYEF
jgi:hypothetical protein